MKITIKLLVCILTVFPVVSDAKLSCLGMFLRDETLFTENIYVYLVEDVAVDLSKQITLGSGDKHQVVQEESKALGALVQAVRGDRNVDTVLYPAGGFDAGPAFLMFPTASTVISLDNHRFVSEGYPSHMRVTPKLPHTHNSRFSHVEQVDVQESKSHMVAAQIASLQVSFPTLRIHRVAELRTVQGASSHGWIDFDLGEGTPLHRYIHLDETFSPNSRWIKPILSYGFEGLLIKGSMEIFSKGFYSMGAPFLEHLEQKQGVAVDADGKLWSEVERFYPLGNEKFANSFELEDMTIHFTDIQLGYDRMNNKRSGVKIVELKP